MGLKEPIDRLQILVVEDDADARHNLSDILELQSHHVATCSNFGEALTAIESTTFDVIILDRKLPDGMVEERLPQFREKAPSTDLIVVTGFADAQASITALREGVTDYLIKPIDAESLLRSLQHIARRRTIERELAKEHSFAEMVLRTAEAVVLVLDCQGRITRFNSFLADLTGHTLAEVQDKDWFDTFIPPAERASVRQIFKQTLAEEGSRGILNSIMTKQGDLREIRWSNSAIRDDDGIVTGVLAVGLDVTELNEAERKSRRSDRLATIGQTMAGMAHESRNALQRIFNSVELLEDEVDENPEAMRLIRKISRAGDDLLDLLEEVRSYAAPIKLDLEQVAIDKIWRSAWESLHPKSASGRLIEASNDSHAPELLFDKRRGVQVFRNLFENAFDACGDETVLQIAATVEDNHLVIRLTDNGPGMSKEVREHVFDAFFTTKPTGTGLGMAIVHRIIEEHGGTIRVTDAQPGTQFEISLPYAKLERASP